MEDDLERYLKLIPLLSKNFLDRVEGFQLNDKADLPENLRILGLETELVEISRLLLGLKGKNERIPSFDELTRVVEGIAYYFIPPSLKSSTNPMCGMRDVLQNAKFQDQVLAKIQELEEKIVMLNGPEVMGKLDAALLADPENQGVMAQKRKVEEAIGINSKIFLSKKRSSNGSMNSLGVSRTVLFCWDRKRKLFKIWLQPHLIKLAYRKLAYMEI